MRENDSSSSFDAFYNLSLRRLSLFRISHAAVEMWEIRRSQMRIAARERRFVAARTIKHRILRKIWLQKLLSHYEQTTDGRTNTEVVATSKFLWGLPYMTSAQGGGGGFKERQQICGQTGLPADIGWPTGKLSNRQACCLAQLCLAAA